MKIKDYIKTPLSLLLMGIALISCGNGTTNNTEIQVGTYELHSSPLANEAMTSISAWDAAADMSFGTNIGNTLENTTFWETGWGQPVITKGYIDHLAVLGFKVIRLPVSWDTYATGIQITEEKMERVGEVVNWITDAGMYCVVNIHWDGGWINSGNDNFPENERHTFTDEAEAKFIAYWEQIAYYFKGKNQLLLFEGLNEESNFENEDDPFGTLQHVNQVFIDTVRASGGNNEDRILIISGYETDFQKTYSSRYKLPTDRLPNGDTVEDRLMLSVHYYTPSTFCILTEDADWGDVRNTWGTAADISQLEDLFNNMADYGSVHNIPIFIGEYDVSADPVKESASRISFLTKVTQYALDKNMVPVLWETGDNLNRNSPYEPVSTDNNPHGHSDWVAVLDNLNL